MPKTTRSYMVRRGRRYLIERTAEGTFSRWIPVGGGAKKSTKKSAKRVSGRKNVGVKTSTKTTGRGRSTSSRSRARA
jgi:hypothetical protein